MLLVVLKTVTVSTARMRHISHYISNFAQCWVDSVKSVTSHDFLTQSSQVTSHAAPVDSVKSRCRAVTVTE